MLGNTVVKGFIMASLQWGLVVQKYALGYNFYFTQDGCGANVQEWGELGFQWNTTCFVSGLGCIH